MVGKGGQGKTTLLRQRLRDAARALVFDPLHIMSPGLVLYSHGELETWLDSHAEDPVFRVLYRPLVDEADRKGMKAESEYFCRAARYVEHCDLIFDEIDAIYEAEGEADPQLWALLNFGRNHSVSVRGTVRRPQVDLPRKWVTECNLWSIFYMDDTLDLAKVTGNCQGVSVDDIRALTPFHYIECDKENAGRITKREMKNPYNEKKLGGENIKKE